MYSAGSVTGDVLTSLIPTGELTWVPLQERPHRNNKAWECGKHFENICNEVAELHGLLGYRRQGLWDSTVLANCTLNYNSIFITKYTCELGCQ